MRLRFVITTMLLTYPAFAETLAEAVSRGLIANPEAIFNLSNQESQLAYAPKINHFTHFKDDAPSDLRLKTQGAANELALGVVSHYLSLSFQEKRLELAKANLRLLRGIYLDKHTKHPLVKKSVASAEAELLKMQTKWHLAQNDYAKVVGKWPKKLQEPPIPDNTILPLSLGEAIEQGLDNYSLASTDDDYFDLEHWHAKKTSARLEKRSMMELTKSIRSAWNDWTEAGLECNLARKTMAEISVKRELYLTKFRANHKDLQKLIQAQDLFYQAESDFNLKEQAELLARYRLLASIGTLVPFINTSPPLNQDNKETIDPMEGLGLSHMDAVSPYPNYKPQFSSDLANTMEMTPSFTAFKTTDVPKSIATAWYVSAGAFKNKANAVALVNRLKGLGFMAFLEIKDQQCSVLVGPYDFPPHALTGMKRLKDIAHLQGASVVAREGVHYG